MVSLFAAGAVAQESAAPAPPRPAPPAAMKAIEAERLIGHANYLASEELGGRLTGSSGQKAAAKYIADHFRTLGLEPLGDLEEGGDR